MSYDNETMHGRFTEAELVTMLQGYLDTAENNDETEASHKREDAIDQYRRIALREGEPGKSQFVTGEVVETIEWAHAALMRGFLARRNTVGFSPRRHDPDAEARCEQATAITNYYMAHRDGAFETLYKVVKDVLLYPAAYVRVAPVYRTWTETRTYSGLTEVGLASLSQDARADDIQFLEMDGEPVTDPMTGQPAIAADGTPAIQAPYSATVRYTYGRWCPEYFSVPPFKMFIDVNHTETSLEDCNFVCEAQTRSRGDWIEMGLDPEKLDLVDSLGEGSSQLHEMFNLHSDTGTGSHLFPYGSTDPDPSMRQITLYNAIVRLDYDGSGFPERRHLLFGGGCIFMDEPIDYMPYVATSAYMVSHRSQGFSLRDLIQEIQELKTQLVRHLLDNLADLGSGRIFVHEEQLRSDGWTLDGLLDPRSGFVITAQPPVNGIMPEPKSPFIQEILTTINWADETRRVRSGVAPEISMNPDVLSKGTAHGFLGAMDSVSQRLEMLARVISEMMVKPVAKKFYHILRTHQDKPLSERVFGRWVETLPAHWEADVEAEVFIGLGHNSQQQMLQLLMQVLPIQQQAIAMNLAGPAGVWHTLSMLVEHAGLGHPEKFFNDPTAPGWQPPQPPPPDPLQVALVQAQVEQTQADAKAKLARGEADMITARTKAIQADDNAQEDASIIERDSTKAVVEMQRLEAETSRIRTETQHANAMLQLEMEKLRAEIEKLRAEPSKGDE